MKKTVVAFALMLASFGAPIAQAQAVPPAPAAANLNGGLLGTGLTGGVAGGILAGVVVIGVVVGNDDDSTTTSSTGTN